MDAPPDALSRPQLGVTWIRAYASAIDDEERKIDAQQQQTPHEERNPASTTTHPQTPANMGGQNEWNTPPRMLDMCNKRLRALISTRCQEDLVVVKELIESGQITPVIGALYPLSEVPKAIRHFEEGHARGKVVIAV